MRPVRAATASNQLFPPNIKAARDIFRQSQANQMQTQSLSGTG